MLNHPDLRALTQQRRRAGTAETGTAPRLSQTLARPQAGLGARRGLRRARGVAHVHSTDAHSVVLRDGSAVLIRQVNGNDAPLLADGFARLSEQSRWMRFLFTKKRLSAADLRYLTEVDHRDHEALGALARDTDTGVGIARYIRDAKDPRSAEIAVTVTDDWQHRGLGTELLDRLSERAREEGFTDSPRSSQ